MPSATGSEKLWNRHSDRGLNLLWDSLLSLLLLWSTLSVLAAQWGTRAQAALCFCAVLSGGELSELTRLRHTAAEELHTLRYGEAPLSQGSLADAGRLNESDAAVLEVRTEQEKTLYLRAYVGAELSENVWSPLPGEAYGGDYAGMLDWLAEQGFNPLTQSALYYVLSGEEAPEPQQLQVDVTGGARCYLYAPITAERVDGAYYGERQDQRMTTRGPLGKRARHRPTNG